jgi:hypothetical protein
VLCGYLMHLDGSETVECWTADGRYLPGEEDFRDLVNAPDPERWVQPLPTVSRPLMGHEYVEHIFAIHRCIIEIRQRIEDIETKHRPGQGLE